MKTYTLIWFFIKLIVALGLIYLLLLATSCSRIPINCISQKTVPVVYVTKSGNYYTFNIPYCDTIKLNTESIDTSKAVKINFKTSKKLSHE